MMVENVLRNLRVLWRADTIIAQAQLQHRLLRLGIQAFAALIFLFGLFCFELGAYFWLAQRYDAIVAAVILGATNLVISACVLIAVRFIQPGNEVQLASELHRSAVEALQADAIAVQSEIQSFKTAMVRPLDSAPATIVVPAASLLIKALKKQKSES